MDEVGCRRGGGATVEEVIEILKRRRIEGVILCVEKERV